MIIIEVIIEDGEGDVIGGTGVIVKIDETHIVIAKHHNSKTLGRQQNWVFGYGKGLKKKFAISLGLGGKRNRATLEPVVVEHIKPGSIIISDQWPAYNNIPNLVDSDGVSLNYEHHTTNHSEAFADDWVHTQTIEMFWGDLKEIVKRRGVNKKVEQHLY